MERRYFGVKKVAEHYLEKCLECPSGHLAMSGNSRGAATGM